MRKEIGKKKHSFSLTSIIARKVNIFFVRSIVELSGVEPQSDRELARNWENEQVSQIHFHQQTFLGYESIHGTVNGTITDEMFIAESKKEMSVMIKLKDEDRQIFFSVIHSSPNITLEPQGHKNDCPEEDLEENLLQENPEAVFD
ncbi:12981_t:CDS:2, partial [Funneliformis geosporum]